MDTKLNELAKALFEARRDEDAAKKKRIETEEAIALLVETGDNGSKTVDCGDGLKVVVKRELGYTADLAAIRALDLSDELLPVLPTPPVPAGYEFDKKAYEKLRTEHPDAFAIVAKYVEIKPRKVAVSLKLA